MQGDEIKDAVRSLALYLDGEYWLSRRGVPIATISRKGHKYNICYFGKSNIWRVFDCQDQANKHDYPSEDDVIAWALQED